MKPPYAISSVPSLSSHAIAYRWRSLPRVRRHRASKPQDSSERVLPWQVTMDQLICVSLSHTHYWYAVGMLKVPATYQRETIAPRRNICKLIGQVCTAFGGIPKADQIKAALKRLNFSRHWAQSHTPAPVKIRKTSRKFSFEAIQLHCSDLW